MCLTSISYDHDICKQIREGVSLPFRLVFSWELLSDHDIHMSDPKL